MTRPQLLHDSLDQCVETVTDTLVSYSTQAERYLNDCVIGKLNIISASDCVVREWALSAWSSDVVNLKANAEASTLKAKAWTFEAKATGPEAKDRL